MPGMVTTPGAYRRWCWDTRPAAPSWKAKTRGSGVVLNPLVSCGACAFCLDGRANLCASRELIGMRRPGAFAERVAIPERNLIPLPEGMDSAKAALTEPCATAWHALVLAARASWRPIPECRTLVIGGGSVGLLGGLILRAWGAGEVRLAETNPLRRQTAASAGLDAFDPLADPAEPGRFDLVLDAVGGTPRPARGRHRRDAARWCHFPCRPAGLGR